MRQILLFAWLWAACSAITACNGQAFAPNEETDDGAPTSAESAGGNSAGREGGKSSDAGSGSSQMPTRPPAPGSGGNITAGFASGGGSGGSSKGGSGSTSAGGSSDACVSGSVKFRMLPGPALPAHHLCDAGCGTGWLTITDAAGTTAFSIVSACGTASCESCEPLPCAASACMPTPLTTEGSELVWSGTYLTQGTCGNKVACQHPTCMPPGRYKAKACAALSAGPSAANGSCTPQDAAPLCVEVEFDFPETRELDLVLN